jgi:hypothetical protein
LGHEAHDRRHAGAERSSDQVGGGESGALPAIIQRGIAIQGLVRRAMSRSAMKPALVDDVDFYSHKKRKD